MGSSAENNISAPGRSIAQFAEAVNSEAGRPLKILDPALVQDLLVVVEEPINSWKTVTVTFRAKHKSYLSDVLQPFLNQTSAPTAMFRFGIQHGSSSQWRGWEEHSVIGYRASDAPDPQSGPLVTIKTADKLWAMDEAGTISAHFGSTGEVVSSLWSKAGGSGSSIEATTLPGHSRSTPVWYQAHESDLELVVQKLLPASVNTAGIGGYWMYVRDGILHFHTIGYGSKAPRKIRYSAGEPGFTGLAVSDRVFEMALEGGSGSAAVFSDPLTGESGIIQSSLDGVSNFASARPKSVCASSVGLHVGLNLKSEETAATQHRHSSMAGEAFQLELGAEMCLGIRVGDLIDVELVDNTGGVSPHSGIWAVSRAVSTLREGGLSTRFIAVRSGLKDLPATPVTDPESPEPGAQGSANTGQIPTLGLTRKSTPTGTIVSVQQPE